MSESERGAVAMEVSKRAQLVLVIALSLIYGALTFVDLWQQCGVLATVENNHVYVRQPFGPSAKDAAAAGYEVTP